MTLVPLKIEFVGNPRQGFRPAWVDEVIGIVPRGLEKVRLEGQADYSKANSVGSRGVYKYFFLVESKIYHVSAPESWKHTDQYFCRIEGGQIIRMEMEEVIDWFVKRHWANRSTKPLLSE